MTTGRINQIAVETYTAPSRGLGRNALLRTHPMQNPANFPHTNTTCFVFLHNESVSSPGKRDESKANFQVSVYLAASSLGEPGKYSRPAEQL
jgi:hypothetical protein